MKAVLDMGSPIPNSWFSRVFEPIKKHLITLIFKEFLVQNKYTNKLWYFIIQKCWTNFVKISTVVKWMKDWPWNIILTCKSRNINIKMQLWNVSVPYLIGRKFRKSKFGICEAMSWTAQKVYFASKKCNFTLCQVYIVHTIFEMKMQKIEEMSSTHYTVRV